MPPNGIDIPMAEAHIFTNSDKSRWYLEDALASEYREFSDLDSLMDYLRNYADSPIEN
jgi:hypothetical protein